MVPKQEEEGTRNCRKIDLIGYQSWNLYKTRKSIGGISWADQISKGRWCYTRLGSILRKKMIWWNETGGEFKGIATA